MNKTPALSLLPALLLASCAFDMSNRSAADIGLKDAGRTAHLTTPCLLEYDDILGDRLSMSAGYKLHPFNPTGNGLVTDRDVWLPKGQEVFIEKYRKFVINEAGMDTGAVGVVKGGKDDGKRFVYVLPSWDFGHDVLGSIPWK